MNHLSTHFTLLCDNLPRLVDTGRVVSGRRLFSLDWLKVDVNRQRRCARPPSITIEMVATALPPKCEKIVQGLLFGLLPEEVYEVKRLGDMYLVESQRLESVAHDIATETRKVSEAAVAAAFGLLAHNLHDAHGRIAGVNYSETTVISTVTIHALLLAKFWHGIKQWSPLGSFDSVGPARSEVYEPVVADIDSWHYEQFLAIRRATDHAQ